MHSIEEKSKAFERLHSIMYELRSQCPWDMKQTISSLKNLTIEETYELADAISENNMNGLKEELGDIFLHLIFYSVIAEEKNAFDIADVLHAQAEKLIRRHPHIYGDVKVANEDDVKKNWEQIKLKEGKKSVLQGVPKALPALVKAYRIQEKAAQVKFEWETTEQVWSKVKEELEELSKEIHTQEKNTENIEEEFGDVLFSLINLSRFLNIDPEFALEKTNKKFISRFQYIEEKAREKNLELKEMSLDEMDTLWNEAKEKNKK